MTAFYSQCHQVPTTDSLPVNIAVCQPPDAGIGYSEALRQAEAAFGKLFPGRSFYPSAQRPHEDPDDIDLGA